MPPNLLACMRFLYKGVHKIGRPRKLKCAREIEFKGELNPEMKLCELLVLGHCIHLPLILFACASSGQGYSVLKFFELLSKSTLLIAPGFEYVYLFLISRVW